MNKVINLDEIRTIDLSIDNLWKQEYQYEKFSGNTPYSSSNQGISHCIKVDTKEQLDYLRKMLEKQYLEKPAYEMLYRGQRNIHWFLLSSLEREIHKLPTEKITSDLYNKIYERIYQEVLSKNKIAFKETENKLQDMIDVFSIGQHYGLYTPLMDWSKSFDIALYFAFQDECEDGYRAVYRIFSDFTWFGNEQYRIIEPKIDLFGRIKNQQGVFSWWGAEHIFRQSADKIEEVYKSRHYALSKEQAKAKMLTKYYISDKLAKDIRAELERKGINKDYICPDFEKSISDPINQKILNFIKFLS